MINKGCPYLSGETVYSECSITPREECSYKDWTACQIFKLQSIIDELKSRVNALNIENIHLRKLTDKQPRINFLISANTERQNKIDEFEKQIYNAKQELKRIYPLIRIDSKESIENAIEFVIKDILNEDRNNEN